VVSDEEDIVGFSIAYAASFGIFLIASIARLCPTGADTWADSKPFSSGD